MERTSGRSIDMLTATGMIFITSDPTEKKMSYGVFFNCEAVARHPKTGKRCWYKVDIFASTEEIEEAQKYIHKGSNLQIRFGEIEGNKSDAGHIYNNIKCSWKNIEPWKIVPSKTQDK